jgi:hypothetical protein
MRNNRSQIPADLHNQITAAADAFAQDIVAMFEQQIRSVADQFAGAAVPAVAAKRGPKPGAAAAKKALVAPVAAPVAAKRAPAPAAAPRVDPNADIKQRLLQTIRKNKSGLGAEQLNRILGTNTKALALPLQELMTAGKIKRTGVARGTKYLII